MQVLSIANRIKEKEEAVLESKRSNINSKQTVLVEMNQAMVIQAMQQLKETAPWSNEITQAVVNDLNNFAPEIYEMVKYRVERIVKKYVEGV